MTNEKSTREKLEAILDDPNKPFGLLTKIHVKDEAAGDRLAEAMEPVIDASRREAGNIAYHVNRDATDPTVFLLYDRWASTQAVEDHENSAHFKKGLETFSEVVTKAEDPVVLQIVDPDG